MSTDLAARLVRERRELLRYLAAALGFAVLLLVVFGDFLLSSEPTIPSHAQGDAARYFVWMRLFGYSELGGGGGVPLWNPHVFSGMPFVGNFQSAMYYPPNLLYLVSDLRTGLVLEFMIALFVMGMSSFAWLRRKGLLPVASFVGAVVVIFASTVTLRVLAGQYTVLGTFCWWPLLLCSIDTLEERWSLGWLLTGTLALGFMILAGHPPTVLQAGLATSLYVVWSVPRCERRFAWLASLAPIALMGPLLAAVQLFEGLGTAAEGLRREGMPYAFATSHSFPPEQLLTLLSADVFGNADRFHLTYFGRVFYWDATFFVGIVGLLLAVHGAFGPRRAQRLQASVLAVLLTVIAMGGNTPLYRVLYHGLPGFEFARAPSKILFFASLFVAWLAALGAERLLRGRAGAMRTAAVGGGLAAVAGGLALWTGLSEVSLDSGRGPMAVFMTLAGTGDFVVEGVAADWHPRLLRSAMIGCVSAAIAAALFAATRWRREAGLVLLVLAIVELTAFARIGRGETRMTIELGLRPEITKAYTRSGTTRVQETSAPSNIAMARRNYGLYGYDPVILGRYIEFMFWSQGQDWRHIEKPTRFIPYHFHPTFSMLRTQWRVDWKTKETIEHGGAWPRFVFVDAYRVEDRADVLDVMAEPGFDPRRLAVLEESPVPEPEPGGASGVRPRARILSESSDHLDVEVELDAPLIMLVSDAYSEGWRARPLEGSVQAEYRVLPANYVLRAIPLTAGSHRFRLEYAPPLQRAGEIVSTGASLAYMAGVGVWALGSRRRTRARD